MPRELTETYSPKWAPHFVGRYEPRSVDPDTGMPEPQHFVVDCHFPGCGAHFEGDCDSGFVNQRIANLAVPHTHRGPLDPLPGAEK